MKDDSVKQVFVSLIYALMIIGCPLLAVGIGRGDAISGNSENPTERCPSPDGMRHNDGSVAKVAMGRGYAVSRTLADAVKKVSGRKLPAYVNGNPDLYVMVKRDAEATVVGLWNIFADSVLDGVVELDCRAENVEFFNCTGRATGDTVVIDEISPFAFAGIILKKAVAQ